jgi:hypothetical protein
VPFPPDAADIIFDQHWPYLGCIAPAAFDATVNFFRKEMRRSAGSRCPPPKPQHAGRTPSSARRSRTARVPITHEDGDSFYRQQPVM